jgi:ribosomal protein S18 acetylase RimI-like enzyme
MTVLAPMPPAAFPDYVAACIRDYADDAVASGRWLPAGALERARHEFDGLLPHGLATADNHLMEIKASDDGPAVGTLWFTLEEYHGHRSAFVYGIEVQPVHRRQGHATRALAALESRLRDLGAESVGLHVFGHNQAAQSLYAKLGYAVVGVNMQKLLEPVKPAVAGTPR